MKATPYQKSRIYDLLEQREKAKWELERLQKVLLESTGLNRVQASLDIEQISNRILNLSAQLEGAYYIVGVSETERQQFERAFELNYLAAYENGLLFD